MPKNLNESRGMAVGGDQLKWNDFEAEISKHIRKFKDDPDYRKWSENEVWRKFDFSKPLNERDIDQIITFLDKWGGMARVNGKIKKQMGKDKMYKELIKASQINQSLFSYLKNLEFEDFDFKKAATKECVHGKTYKDVIEEIFENFENVIKHTSSSKIMHMVNPNLFVMWDKNIRDSWGCSANARGYFNFLIRMQLEFEELVKDYIKVKGVSKTKGTDKLLNELNSRIGHECPITRWIDVYNWINTREKKRMY